MSLLEAKCLHVCKFEYVQTRYMYIISVVDGATRPRSPRSNRRANLIARHVLRALRRRPRHSQNHVHQRHGQDPNGRVIQHVRGRVRQCGGHSVDHRVAPGACPGAQTLDHARQARLTYAWTRSITT